MNNKINILNKSISNIQDNNLLDKNKLLDENEIKSFQSLLIFNDNLRKHIKLSLSIYKKLNNFDHKYIHQFFNENIQTKTHTE